MDGIWGIVILASCEQHFIKLIENKVQHTSIITPIVGYQNNRSRAAVIFYEKSIMNIERFYRKN